MRFFFKFLFSLLLVSVAMFSLASVNQNNLKNKARLLFVITAPWAHIVKSHNHINLVINQLSPQVLWFTDRPQRKAGFVSIKHFVQGWQQAFGHEAPNAALVHVDLVDTANQNNHPMAIALYNPQYGHHQLSFQIKSLNGFITSKPLQHVSLFVDASFPQSPHRLTPYPNFQFKTVLQG